MGRVPGATSWPTAVVEFLVPSQAAACDNILLIKNKDPEETTILRCKLSPQGA